MSTPLTVGIIVYDGVEPLDVVGPVSILIRVTPPLQIFYISTTEKLIVNQATFTITATHTFRQLKPGDIDVVIVPGAGGSSLDDVLLNTEFLDWLRSVSERAKWVTSVCIGSVILAAAGLLKGYKATSHWIVIPLLEQLKEKGLVGEVIKWHERKPNPRYVHEGNRITGAGVSSGIDSTLAWVHLEYGIEPARLKDLEIQYRGVEDEEMAFLKGAGDPSTVEKFLLEKEIKDAQGWLDTTAKIIDHL